MSLPGMTENVDQELWEKSQQDTAKLAETLKSEVQVESKEIGVLRRELKVTVPAKVIADHMEHQYSELMHDALVPGFRKGRAPRRLVEKRYGGDVRESLTTTIIGQSFYAAAEKEKIESLGDPLFRVEEEGGGVKLLDIESALRFVKLPEQGDFSFVCEVELKPSFELPELTNIPIKRAEIQITDAMVDEQILNRRKYRGRFEPIESAAEKDDQIIVDVILSSADGEVKREDNLTLGVRPTRLDGVLLSDMGEKMQGARPGETRTVECVFPDDYERADLRGKPGKFEFKIHEIKRLHPEDLAAYIQNLGYETEAELREEVRRDLESERDALITRANKGQVEEYLLNTVNIDLPTQFSARQTDRAVIRKVVDLQTRGVPMSDVEAHIDELRTSAKEEVARELKLGFILEKIAAERSIEVTDEEVNSEIAAMAQRYNKRFDRVRDDLQSRGLLPQLVEQIRQDKVVSELLKDAKWEAPASA